MYQSDHTNVNFTIKKKILTTFFFSDTLVELFVTDLLPPDRKLKTLSQRPLQLLDELSSGNPAGRRRRLIAWYFEDQLKSIFRDFVDSLRTIAGEAVESNKEKAIKAMAKLLESHPEQEGVCMHQVHFYFIFTKLIYY